MSGIISHEDNSHQTRIKQKQKENKPNRKQPTNKTIDSKKIKKFDNGQHTPREVK
jgi:hypothetical protein